MVLLQLRCPSFSRRPRTGEPRRPAGHHFQHSGLVLTSRRPSRGSLTAPPTTGAGVTSPANCSLRSPNPRRHGRRGAPQGFRPTRSMRPAPRGTRSPTSCHCQSRLSGLESATAQHTYRPDPGWPQNGAGPAPPRRCRCPAGAHTNECSAGQGQLATVRLRFHKSRSSRSRSACPSRAGDLVGSGLLVLRRARPSV